MMGLMQRKNVVLYELTKMGQSITKEKGKEWILGSTEN
jgi:hypothetical protein